MYRIGIDLGGTNISAGIVNDSYEILCKMSCPTKAERQSDAIVQDIIGLCGSLCQKAGLSLKEDISMIGIASPGIADSKTGMIVYSCNLPFSKYPVCEVIRSSTGVKDMRLENDANAAALGEAVAGSAKGSENSILITLGTGVGGGVLIHHRIVSGFNAAGGELGHIVIEKDGVPCNCGRKGCWESYSSATALIRMTKEKADECRKNSRSSLLTDAEKITGRTAFDAARKGDAAALEVLRVYYDYLACGLTNIINIFQPETISIGGGISGEGQSMIDELEPRISREVYGKGIVPSTKIRIASLGNDAGIIGAAALSEM